MDDGLAGSFGKSAHGRFTGSGIVHDVYGALPGCGLGITDDVDILLVHGRGNDEGILRGHRQLSDVEEPLGGTQGTFRTVNPVSEQHPRLQAPAVQVGLTDERGALVSENLYWRGKEEGNLQALKSVAPATLSGEVLSSAAGGEVRLTLRLENTGDTPAMMLRVKVTDTATGDLVVPVLYSDNYFFLMPGESREVSVRLQKEDMAGLPKVSVSGFNVDEREFSKK